MYFNSHAHVERDHTLRLHRRCQRNFNSHAHVERDVPSQPAAFGILWISTHTLTWSVTVKIAKAKIVSDISTHTLTWSVTKVCKYG